MATVIFVGLCNIETDFSLIMGGLITNLFAFYLVLRMMPTSSVKLPMNVFSFR